MADQFDIINSINTMAIWSQVTISGLMLCGAMLIDKKSNKEPIHRRNNKYLVFKISIWVLLAIAILAVSDSSNQKVRILFSDIVTMNGIPLFTAILLSFSINIWCIFVLVMRTGGSVRSEFTPFYFLIPTLAIFLYLPDTHVYILLAGIIGAFLLTSIHYDDSHTTNKKILVFNAVICVSMATYIGVKSRSTYITYQKKEYKQHIEALKKSGIIANESEFEGIQFSIQKIITPPPLLDAKPKEEKQ